MKNSHKAWVIFRHILTLLFIFFLINYYQVASGNYKSEINRQTILTEEKIKEFEEDVKNGTFVDIKDYTENTYVDTSNTASNIGAKVGECLDSLINEKAKGIIDFIGKFIS